MSTLCRILACIAFALVTLGVPAYNLPLLPLGLFLWCISTLIPNA